MTSDEGQLRKVPAQLGEPIDDCVRLGEEPIALNPLLGHELRITLLGLISCIALRRTRASDQLSSATARPTYGLLPSEIGKFDNSTVVPWLRPC
jgi:hypothetical protein